MTSFLIVDDQPRFRTLARLLLEQDGHSVVGEAGDAETALAAARELEPEVVLLDVELPDGNGFDVARRLTEAAAAPRVVMTSTHDGADFDALARRSGAEGFVPKDDLSAAAIDRLLD